MYTKHTPGPWTASGPSELNGRFSVYHNGPLIYCDNEADARLIAAAPDLLEALEDALDNLETLVAHGVPVSESGKRAMQSYRAAIARATGN